MQYGGGCVGVYRDHLGFRVRILEKQMEKRKTESEMGL